MMHGFMEQAAQIKRDRGAREVLARHPDIKLLADQTAEWDRARAMSLTVSGHRLAAMNSLLPGEAR
ncbi:MAG TPA: hypothetical protein PLY00_16800 [Verrucomicrobiota bacterium]|jgi:inositol transport system substrate-binding protein|nr:hypothetical protein [Verrucomicrobiota bacterium]OQC66453.1 MAG: hypothetical protein BWX48_01596 [Verrucomicrobia bacterium ADurb.Bin006]HOA62779.1 hypothetical protein [Verrucomicrobiota bacterium]HOF49820.1 hypothetical protein [Verrucomicrobiota bacterium]HOG88537.1 hypothetical protein [Verrucomicrobiota bacterium]